MKGELIKRAIKSTKVRFGEEISSFLKPRSRGTRREAKRVPIVEVGGRR